MNGDSITAGGVEAEYTDIATKNAWALVYQKICRECQAYPYTCTEAKRLENKSLNRYRDVNPYDHSRVILKRCEKDYINANVVKMDRANRKYILTQGPLPLTVSHFWLMVWEQNSRAILMLNKVIEKSEPKCHWYWPRGRGEKHKMVLEDVQLTVKQIYEQDFGHFTTRVFRMYDMVSKECRDVYQYHYTTWPDFGVPQSPSAFLEFLMMVRESGTLEETCGPAVVHCSAGIGRSGTFCLVDSCLVMIEKEGIECVNVQQVLLEMRKDRMGLIQTPDQLRFSYQAIIEGAKRLISTPQKLVADRSVYTPIVIDYSSSEDEVEDEVEKEDEDEDEEEEEEEDEEEAPAPPPRGESLGRAPARPLPSIPTSVSFGNNVVHRLFTQTSEDSPVTSPASEPPPPARADYGEKEPLPDSVEPASEVRRRRTRELAERVSEVKRRVRDAERWHDLRASLYKPLAITLGIIITGIAAYSYFKH